MVRDRVRKQRARKRRAEARIDNAAPGALALQPDVLGASGKALQLLPKLTPEQEAEMLVLYKEEGLDGVMLGYGYDEHVATRVVGRAVNRAKVPLEEVLEAEGLNDVKLARTHAKLLNDNVSDQVREKALTAAHKLKGRLSDKPDKSAAEAAADAIVKITEVLAGTRTMPEKLGDEDDVPLLGSADEA